MDLPIESLSIDRTAPLTEGPKKSLAPGSTSKKKKRHGKQLSEAGAPNGTPQSSHKRVRTSYDAFVDQELESITTSSAFASQALVDNLRTGLYVRWSTMSREEMQLYEDLAQDDDFEGLFDVEEDDSPLSSSAAAAAAAGTAESTVVEEVGTIDRDGSNDTRAPRHSSLSFSEAFQSALSVFVNTSRPSEC